MLDPVAYADLFGSRPRRLLWVMGAPIVEGCTESWQLWNGAKLVATMGQKTPRGSVVLTLQWGQTYVGTLAQCRKWALESVR